MNALLCRGFESYLSTIALGENEGLVFLHLPKTAGVSLGDALKREFADEEVFPIPWDQIDTAVNNLVLPDDKRFLSMGHIRFKHLTMFEKRFKNRVDYKVATVIRDPIKRIVSEYYYSCSPSHPPHQEFIKKFPTLEHWVFNHLPPNPMATTLSGINNDFKRSLNFIINNYDSILVLEQQEKMIQILRTMFSNPQFSLPTKNQNKAKNYSKDMDLRPHTRKFLEEYLAIDIALYEFFNACYN